MTVRARFRPPRVPHACRIPERASARLRACAPGDWCFVAAPAGYGKSTAVAATLAAPDRAVWIRVAPDAGVERWVLDLGRALGGLAPGVADAVELWSRGAAEPVDAAELLADALDDLGATGAGLDVIVDDAHHLAPAAEATLEALLALPLATTRWFVLARGVPRLAQRHRLDPRVHIVEVDDLRLPDDAIHDELRRVAPDLADDAAAALVADIAGWPAALRLATLALAADPSAAPSLAGAGAQLVDYLRTTVLDRLAPPLRHFVAHTAHMPRLDDALARALAGDAVRVDDAWRAGLFLERSGDADPAYRYHDLFRRAAEPFAIATLGEPAVDALIARGAARLAADGALDDAVALLARRRDDSGLADLIDTAGRARLRRGEGRRVLRWIARGPEGWRDRGRVGVVQAWARLIAFEWPETRVLVAALAHDAEVRGDPRLEGERRLIEGTLALAAGEVPDVTTAFAGADAILPPDHHDARAVLHGETGTALAAAGRLDAADASLRRAVDAAAAAGNALVLRAARWYLAEHRLHRGDLDAAIAAHRLALDDGGDDAPRVAASGLAEALRERGDLDAGSPLLVALLDAARERGAIAVYLQACITAARLDASRGRWPDAHDWLVEARRWVDRTGLHPWRATLDAYRAAFALREGATAADVRGLDAPGPTMTFIANHAPEHVALVRARLELAAGRPGEAVAALDELAATARAGGRRRSALELDLVRAIAAHHRGDADLARDRLADASADALAGGFRNVIREEPLPAALAAALPEELAARPPGPAGPAHAVDCPLSERELEVLALVADGRTNADAAKLLFVAPSTIKKHLENIYARLSADNRTHAVAIARAHGWLPAA